MGRTGGWFQTFTGKQFYLTDPHPDDVCVEDIAHALANTCRFGGHTREFYSTAQHSVHVADFIEEFYPENSTLQLHGLVHDAAEAYLGDVVRPLKDGMSEYKRAEVRMMDVIYRALGLTPATWEEFCIIKHADNSLLMAERRDLVNHRNLDWSIEEKPWDRKIEPWHPLMAEGKFKSRYFSLSREVALTR